MVFFTEGVIPGVVVSTAENDLIADWLVEAVAPSAEKVKNSGSFLLWIPTADIQLNENQFCHCIQ